MTSRPDRLTPRQRELLAGWLPGHEVEADLGWGLVGTTVLRLRHHGESYVAKAGDAADHHLARELRAHREWLQPWTDLGRAPTLVHADGEAKLLVTRWLPGVLVEGECRRGGTGRLSQAGRLLAALHGQLAVVDDGFEARARDKALVWLGKEHRIAPDVEQRLRAEVTTWPTPPATLEPTHGDWQPRNWLVHDGVVSVIDLGRADLRPALTDLSRLAVQQFPGRPGAGAGVPGGLRRTASRRRTGRVAPHAAFDEVDRLQHVLVPGRPGRRT